MLSTHVSDWRSLCGRGGISRTSMVNTASLGKTRCIAFPGISVIFSCSHLVLWHKVDPNFYGTRNVAGSLLKIFAWHFSCPILQKYINKPDSDATGVAALQPKSFVHCPNKGTDVFSPFSLNKTLGLVCPPVNVTLSYFSTLSKLWIISLSVWPKKKNQCSAHKTSSNVIDEVWTGLKFAGFRELRHLWKSELACLVWLMTDWNLRSWTNL